MHSMTGYGSSVSKSKSLELEIQIRSVNSRFLDLRFHLPREYFGFESDLKKRVSKQVSRGCIDVYIQRRPVAEAQVVPIKFNKGQAKAWFESIQSLKKTLGLKDDVNLRDLLSLPHIFDVNERTDPNNQEEAMVTKTFD